MCQRKGQQRRPYESLFNHSKKRAITPNNRGQGHAWSITYEEFLSFVKIKLCHYCKVGNLWPLPFGPRNELGEYKFRSNLDRKNNALSYTKKNCVVCCPNCNVTKSSHLSYEEMLKVGEMRRKERKNV
jgi:5-methylcytosine-specific restriction endonuclease McrA